MTRDSSIDIGLSGGLPESIPARTPAERQPDFLWSGRPVYRCQVCADRYERIDDLTAVLQHETEAHEVAPTVRESRILGADGHPIVVAS